MPPIQEGYEAVLYEFDTVTKTYSTSSRALSLARQPDLRRTFRVKYDTCLLKLNNEVGGDPVKKQDRIEVRENGVLVFHGLVVRQPKITHTSRGAFVDVEAASLPFLLWKKATRDWNLAQGSDVDAIKNLLLRNRSQSYPFESNAEIQSMSNTFRDEGFLRLAGTPGSYPASGTAVLATMPTIGAIQTATLTADSVLGTTLDIVEAFLSAASIDAGASTAGMFDAFYGLVRLPDRTTVTVEPFDGAGALQEGQNVVVRNGKLTLSSYLIQQDFEATNPVIYPSTASFGVQGTLSPNSAGTGGNKVSFQWTDGLWYLIVPNSGTHRLNVAGTGIESASPTNLHTFLSLPAQPAVWHVTGIQLIGGVPYLWMPGGSSQTPTGVQAWKWVEANTRWERDATQDFSGLFNGSDSIYGYWVSRGLAPGYLERLNWLIRAPASSSPGRSDGNTDALALSFDADLGYAHIKFDASQGGSAQATLGQSVTGAPPFNGGNRGAELRPPNLTASTSVPSPGSTGFFKHALRRGDKCIIHGVGTNDYYPINLGTYTTTGVGTGHGQVLDKSAYAYVPELLRRGTVQFDIWGQAGATVIFSNASFSIRLRSDGTIERLVSGQFTAGESLKAWAVIPGATYNMNAWNTVKLEIDTQANDPSAWLTRIHVNSVDYGTFGRTTWTQSNGVPETQADEYGSGTLGLVVFLGPSPLFTINIDNLEVWPGIGAPSGTTGYAVIKPVTHALPVHRLQLGATTSIPGVASITFEASVDNGVSWRTVTPNGSTYTDFPVPGTQVLIRVTLNTTDPAQAPTVDEYTLTAANGYLLNTNATMQTINLGNGVVVGEQISIASDSVVSLPQGTSISWFVSSNGGANFFTHPGPGSSITIPLAQRGTDIRIRAVLKTTNQANTPRIDYLHVVVSSAGAVGVSYELSRDDGATYHAVTPGTPFSWAAFPNQSPKNRLRARITLTSSNPNATPKVNQVDVQATTEGLTYVRLGAEPSEVVVKEASFPIRYFYQNCGRALEDLVRATGAESWWRLDPLTGIYYLNYNVARPSGSPGGSVGGTIRSLEGSKDALKYADRFILVGRSS
jgi:hypothetical protein